ncbi:MAG: phosphoglucosamine mutase [Atribacterota bacterium]
MNTLFGTDGIRGLANQYPMNAELAFYLGQTIGYYNKNKKNKDILLGKDTRISGDMLEAALTAGLCSKGMNVLNVGIATTPAVGYLTKYYHANMGVVISASHNPYYDNGIKIFQDDGLKINKRIEREIEKILFQEKYKKIQNTGSTIGRVIPLNNARKIYLEHIMDTIPPDFKKPEYRIVLDCANGSSSLIIPELLTKLKISFTTINYNPNGININHKCGSTNISSLQEEVLKEKADLGLAFDGDADRVLAVDEKGSIVNGDQIMVIYANTFIKEGKLGNKVIVTTHMSNLGFDETINEIGGYVIRTDIGDKYVLKKMLSTNSLLGGEQSGHIIFLPYSPNGDGIITALQLLYALNKNNEPVSSQAGRMKKYFQKLLNYKISDKKHFIQNEKFNEMNKVIQNYFKKEGRVLIRFSGTEDKIRILLESKEEKKIKECKKVIDNFIIEMSNFNKYTL